MKNKHCLLCSKETLYDDTNAPDCTNLKCECHSSVTTEWETELKMLQVPTSLMPSIKSFIRKIYQRGYEKCWNGFKDMDAYQLGYQRGREERYEKGLQDGKRVYVQEFISLAVQEIEKGKYQTPLLGTPLETEKIMVTFNQGLDKAIEIISGLKK